MSSRPKRRRVVTSTEESIDIKFRIYDGSDIGPFRFSSASTVQSLKQRVVSDWPQGKTVTPEAVSNIKLINMGKILENSETVGQCRMPFGDDAEAVVVMLVVVQPSQAKDGKVPPPPVLTLTPATVPTLETLPHDLPTIYEILDEMDVYVTDLETYFKSLDEITQRRLDTLRLLTSAAYLPCLDGLDPTPAPLILTAQVMGTATRIRSILAAMRANFSDFSEYIQSLNERVRRHLVTLTTHTATVTAMSPPPAVTPALEDPVLAPASSPTPDIFTLVQCSFHETWAVMRACSSNMTTCAASMKEVLRLCDSRARGSRNFSA